MTRTRRSPAEIAADLAMKADAAKTRAAVAEASTNPALVPLLDLLKKTQTTANQLKRQFADTNPQSFDNRIASYNLRIAEVTAGAKLAAVHLEDAENTVDTLKSLIESYASAIANGEDVSAEIAQDISNLSEPATFPDLETAFEDAQTLRKGFKGSITADDVVVDAPQMEATA